MRVLPGFPALRRAAIFGLASFVMWLPAARADDVQFPPAAFRLATNPYGTIGFINVRSAPYGAYGDGVHNDTAAIRSALNAVGCGTIYFPAGTYLVSDTLRWTFNGYDNPNRAFCGQGRDKTFIKLVDNAAGFGSAATPKAVLETRGEGWDTNNSQGSTAFGNSVYSMTIQTGSGNAGAVGIAWMVSNQGTLRYVNVQSGDGQGVAGINYNGESGGLMQNVAVSGFGYGVQGMGNGYSNMVADGLTLTGQSIAGLRVGNDIFSLASVVSNNAVPALKTDSWASRVSLLDSTLRGGAANQSAVDLNGGTVFLRDVSTAGYGTSLINRANGNATLSPVGISEWTSTSTNRLFPENTPQRSLGLAGTPTSDFQTNDFAQWANVEDYYVASDGSSWSGATQRAIDSGKQVVYFPPNANGYDLGATVYVRGNVRKITGLHAAPVRRLANQSGPAFRFDSTVGPVYFEQFTTWPSEIEINTTQPVVLRDLGNPSVSGMVRNTAGVAANVTIDGATGFASFSSGTKATLRCINPENSTDNIPITTPNISLDNASMWDLGCKSEGTRSQLRATNGSKAEIFGLYYSAFSAPTVSGITNVASSVFAMSHSRFNAYTFDTWATETQNGLTRTANSASIEPLYAGYLNANLVPLPPTNLTATAGAGAVSLAWTAATNATGYTILRSSTTGGPYTVVNSAPITATNFANGGLTGGTTYFYIVRSINANGSSTNSGEANAAPTAAPLASVVFVKTDTTTKGSWKGVYGNDGYNVINNTISSPSYMNVGSNVAPVGNWTSSGNWTTSTSDARALQKAGNATDRIAGGWFGDVYSVALSPNDTSFHQVALYFLDWDRFGRAQTVDVLDATTNTVLNTRNLSNFGNGTYLIWNIKGAVKIRFTLTSGNGGNAVISGLFFGTP